LTFGGGVSGRGFEKAPQKTRQRGEGIEKNPAKVNLGSWSTIRGKKSEEVPATKMLWNGQGRTSSKKKNFGRFGLTLKEQCYRHSEKRLKRSLEKKGGKILVEGVSGRKR